MDASQTKFKTIDEYVNSFPEEVRDRLQMLRQIIKEEAPEAKETIKYNMPTFTLRGNLIYFAAWKNHISVYPATEAMEAAIKELVPYNKGKGTLQFPMSQPLPLPLLREIVAFRVKESIEKK